MARVDWTDLHTRIVAAVELPLARRRRDARTWWRVAAGWSRAATFAAAAAGILFAFAILASDRAAVRRTAVSRVGVEPSAMFVATAVGEDPGLTLLFATDRATLLQAALELE